MLHEAGEQSLELDMGQFADSLDKVRCSFVVYTHTPQARINFDEYTGLGIVPLCGVVQSLGHVQCEHRLRDAARDHQVIGGITKQGVHTQHL